VRSGRLARIGRLPHGRYYGTIDATPLWLIVLSETYRWTGDLNLVRRLRPAAEAALTWMDHYADLDGDGFVEYARRSPAGLENQGWKDSSDAIRFADGRLAEGPIALVEVQGYMYDARQRMAELFEALGELARATTLRRQADDLKRAFNDVFWLPSEGYYALALDGGKRPVDSLTSNAGHALWSGIADDARAAQVAERLLSEEMFSGWGVRTMSSRMLGYSPVSYDNVSVWPHDTALVAAAWPATGSSTTPRVCSARCSRRARGSLGIVCPSCSAASSGSPTIRRWPIRRPMRRKPGRPAAWSWRCERCSASSRPTLS
jgi:glycogen debranching enzyme